MVYNLGAKSDMYGPTYWRFDSEDTRVEWIGAARHTHPDTPLSSPRRPAPPGARGQPQRPTNWQFVRSLDLT